MRKALGSWFVRPAREEFSCRFHEVMFLRLHWCAPNRHLVMWKDLEGLRVDEGPQLRDRSLDIAGSWSEMENGPEEASL